MDKTTLPVIVMEKMHSSLRGLIKEHADIPMNVTLSILNDVCLGLQYLHTRNPPVLHRNLTPSNILLCYHFRAKISDVGVVSTLHTTDTPALSQASKMSAFLPLNSLIGESVSDLSLDVFSFGGVILYITTHQWPQLTSFDANTGGRIALTELQQCQQYLDKMAESYTTLKPLVVSCLDENPEERPSIAQVLMEIKTVKNSYGEQLCSILWESEIFDKQQSLTIQSHKQTEQQQWQNEEQNQHKDENQQEDEHQQKTETRKLQTTHQLDTEQPQSLKVSCIFYYCNVYACLCMHVWDMTKSRNGLENGLVNGLAQFH